MLQSPSFSDKIATCTWHRVVQMPCSFATAWAPVSWPGLRCWRRCDRQSRPGPSAGAVEGKVPLEEMGISHIWPRANGYPRCTGIEKKQRRYGACTSKSLENDFPLRNCMTLPVPGSSVCSKEEVTHPKTVESAHEKCFISSDMHQLTTKVDYLWLSRPVRLPAATTVADSQMFGPWKNHGVPITSVGTAISISKLGTHGFLLILTWLHLTHLKQVAENQEDYSKINKPNMAEEHFGAVRWGQHAFAGGDLRWAQCRGCLETGRSFKTEEMHLALLVHRCPGCLGQHTLRCYI